MPGIRKRRSRTESASRRPTHLQRTFQMLNAALSGVGLAYVPEDLAQPHIAKASSSACSPMVPPYSGTTSITRAPPSSRRSRCL